MKNEGYENKNREQEKQINNFVILEHFDNGV